MADKILTSNQVKRFRAYVRRVNDELLACSTYRIWTSATQRDGIKLAVHGGDPHEFLYTTLKEARAWVDGVCDGDANEKEVVVPFDQGYDNDQMAAHALGVAAIGGSYLSEERSREICEATRSLANRGEDQ